MEPELKLLLEALSEANDQLSKAFIKQSIAFNNVQRAYRELHENHLTLFDQKDI